MQLRAEFPHLPRLPVASDEGEHGTDLGIGELVAEALHVALVTRRRMRRHHAVLGDRKEYGIGMMPCMAALVVRRRGQTAVGAPRAPIVLAFEPGTVARRAVLGIEGGSALERLRSVPSARANEETDRDARAHQAGRRRPRAVRCERAP